MRGRSHSSSWNNAFRVSWACDTSEGPDEWTATNPAHGQCGVTALVIRDLLGGEILAANVLLNGKRVDRHAWNRLPSGLEIDLTRDQFRNGEVFEPSHPEEPIITLRNPERYEFLGARVRRALDQSPPN